MDTQEQQPVKNNLVPIIIVVILVIGVGAGLGYMFMNKDTKNAQKNTQVSQQTPPPQTGEQPTTPPPSGSITKEAPPPPPPSIGFYGKVIKRDGTTVTIQQLSPPTTASGKLTEGKIYTVTAEEAIPYVNQQKAKTTKPGEPPFTPSPGSLSGLVKGLFVYIETSDDIASKTAVKANQVMYSVESPF